VAAQASSFPKKHQRRRAAQVDSPIESDGPIEDQIRLRAYALYLERGGQPGSEIDDWLQAEAELKVTQKA
jgi:hypothetical protein